MNVSIWISAAGLVRVAAAATISPREFSRWAPLTFRNYERRRILLKFRAFYRVEAVKVGQENAAWNTRYQASQLAL